MISDARGGHVSPGIYTEEKDVTYSVKSLGITNLGLVGETVKGPAFQSVPIKDWSEFVDYFGGTSPEKFKGTNLPKYELPYIAENYLKDSKKLNVVRVLGLSGYKTSNAYVVYETDSASNKKHPVVILRSKGDYSGTVSGGCASASTEKFVSYVTSVSISGYTKKIYNADCTFSESSVTIPLIQYVKDHKLMSDSTSAAVEANCFQLVVGYKIGDSSYTANYNVSLNPYDRDYIYNVFSTDPLVGNAPLFIEAVYDYAFDNVLQGLVDGKTVEFSVGEVEDENASAKTYNFNESYRCAQTPWIVSEVKSEDTSTIAMKKLFKFFTISDGNAANYQVKVSIQRVRPDEGLFDVWIRDFYDTDAAPVVLEKFTNLSMVEGSSNYIGYKIGTYDGGFEAKSKYVTVMMADGDNLDGCVPCGFLGYPMPLYGGDERLSMSYNTKYDENVKAKRQYFGLNSAVLDVDVLNYKGADMYKNAAFDADPTKITNGFHLDSILSRSGFTVLVDEESGYTFAAVEPIAGEKLPRIISEAYAEDSLYEDINMRKFTVYPYGGFDGWDIYRNYRTNTNKFKATKYPLVSGCPFTSVTVSDLGYNADYDFNLPSNAITSDYYAYLAGYKVFANPQDVEINIFATPGIDFDNHSLLTEDALDVVEDKEDGRGGDTLYVFNSPKSDIAESSDGLASNGGDYTADDVVSLLEDSNIDSSYACTYWPWVRFYDSGNTTYIDLPATKDVVRNMAYTDNNSYPWFAPAGMERGSVVCVKPCVKTTLAMEDTLYSGRINPIKNFATDGAKVWGNKTAYSVDSPLNRVNARRLMLRVKKLVVDASHSMVFDQYDQSLDAQFKSLVEPILADVKSNRGISDYKVITESTPETRDQHWLPSKILVKPINALEYITISFTIYPESVSFNE